LALATNAAKKRSNHATLDVYAFREFMTRETAI